MSRPRGKQLPNRLCVSFDNATYADLCALARKQGVSASWMIRRAVQEFVAGARDVSEPELPLGRSASGERRAAP